MSNLVGRFLAQSESVMTNLLPRGKRLKSIGNFTIITFGCRRTSNLKFGPYKILTKPQKCTDKKCVKNV